MAVNCVRRQVQRETINIVMVFDCETKAREMFCSDVWLYCLSIMRLTLWMYVTAVIGG